MISSEEFQQKLQAGQIHEALAMLVHEANLFQNGFANELDVTTRMTEDPRTNNQPASHEYLRTKINLLTGDIHNEVGKDLVLDSSSYIKLQQLHADQVVASHRIVQDYLERVKAILTVLSPSQSSGDAVKQADLGIADWKSANVNRIANDEDLPTTGSIGAESPIYAVAVDDDIDLSIDEEGDVWEEWVEDEDFMSESIIISQPPSVAPGSTIPGWEEQSVRRNLHPIEVKPAILRTSTSVDPATQWDKFGPEYVGISADPQPQIVSSSDAHQMDKLLADLDI